MSNKVKRIGMMAWMGVLTLMVVVLGVEQAFSVSAEADFEVINVERINIVEPDGKYRMVLANEERFPGLFMEGQEYKHHSRDGGGLLFFNDEGDEVGGMTFRSAKTDEGYAASAGLMFDQYKQDQTVGVQYSDSNGKRQAGLRVWDRPDYSIKPLMEMSDRAARAESDEDKQAIRKEMMDYAMSHGGVGAERMFAGKQLEDSVIKLNDAEGRARLVLKVDASGAASVEFLDPDGGVVKRIVAD